MTTREPEDIFEAQKENGEEGSNEEIQASTSPDTLRILEAVLFASDELLTTSQLKAILPGAPDAKKIRSMVEKINIQLQKERHPFEIVEIGGGYQFRTISYYYPWVKQIFKEKAEKKLSMQALECLAIIAYKQPISKAEIEAIRGVISDGALKTLLEKRLIGVCGRSDKPGHPLLYGTTQNFLKYFGLNKLEDLPRIEEFEAIAKEKMEGLTEEELSQTLKEEELEEVDIEEMTSLKTKEKSESKEKSRVEESGEKAEVKGENDKVSKEENILTEEIKKEGEIFSQQEVVIETEVEIDNLKSEKSINSEDKEEPAELEEETIFDLDTSSEKKEGEVLSTEGKESIKREEAISEKEEVFELESEIRSAKETDKEKIETSKKDVESISQEEKDKEVNSQQMQVESSIESEEEALDLEEIVTKKGETVKLEEEDAVELEQLRQEESSQETEKGENSDKKNESDNFKKKRKVNKKNHNIENEE